MSAVVLPALPWRETPNQSHRNPATRAPTLIVVHAWGVKPATTAPEARSRFGGTVGYLCNPRVEVSSHIVYGGCLANPKGDAVQLVKWQEKAWTQAGVNSAAISIESADAIWHDGDPEGMAQLARIVAFICHKTGIPPIWVRSPGAIGVARHLDLGALGNPNHHACPTADERPWRAFLGRLRLEAARGDFRKTWGKGVFRRVDA